MRFNLWLVLGVVAGVSSSAGLASAQGVSRNAAGPVTAVLAKLRDSIGTSLTLRDPADPGAHADTGAMRSSAASLGIPVLSRVAWESCGDRCRVGDYLIQVLPVSWSGDTAVVSYHFDRRESAGKRGGIRLGGGIDQFKLLLRDAVWTIVGRGWSVRS